MNSIVYNLNWSKLVNIIKCLDHGFVKLLNIASAIPRNVEEIGDFSARDKDPALVARTSFNKGFDARPEEEDLKLLGYLMSNGHNTPVEMTVLWFEIKMPIFIARQLNRHRTMAINEISGRYVKLEPEWYIPEVVGGVPENGAKQGQSDTLLLSMQEDFKRTLKRQCETSYELYECYLEAGVAPEHARMFLHLNHYTQEVIKIDLHNLMHLMSLRLDSHAQVEARVYAQAIYDLLLPHLPKSMEYFNTYRRKLDDRERAVLRRGLELIPALHGLVVITQEDSDEVQELLAVITKLAARNGVR